MGLRAYKATGVAVRAIEEIFGLDLRPTGLENIPDRPTLFVVNHFTRFETLLVPYVLFQSTRRQVRTLATHTIFHGAVGRHLRSCGVMSTRDPQRNRTIIRELMTRQFDWVIYPEGGLVKTKKVVQDGRLMLDLPHRKGPPHTGGAVLALKAELASERYLEACRKGDEKAMAFYEDRYSLKGPEDICTEGTVIVPVNITYCPLRYDRKTLNRFVQLLGQEATGRSGEELQVEGSLLFGDSQINVHFDTPIEVGAYLGGPENSVRRVATLFSEQKASESLLKAPASRLTRDFMRRIYSNVEVNLDHLFCFAIRSLKDDSIRVEALHKAIYLAALEIRNMPGIRVHPSLERGLTPLVTGELFEPLTSIVQLAQQEDRLRIENGTYIIDRDAMFREHAFHGVRVNNMTRVIANELEGVEAATTALRKLVNLPETEIDARVARAARETDSQVYETAYENWYEAGISKPDIGSPFLLEAPKPDIGVLLIHGYLACPAQLRPLAEHLHGLGSTVYGVRLEGHGTSPENLASVSWHDWMESIRRGYAALDGRCDRVIVGGFSLGGVLALAHVSRMEDPPAGVFCVNAPMRLRDLRAPAVSLMVGWKGLLRRLGISDGYLTRDNSQTESPDLNYTIDYLRGVRELRRAMNGSREQLGRITSPALIVQADGDPLIHPDSARIIAAGVRSQDKTLVDVSADRHIIVNGEDSGELFRTIGEFVDRIAGVSRAAPKNKRTGTSLRRPA